MVAGRGTGIELYSLGGGRTLVQVACALGAYQGTYLYYALDSTGRRPRGPLEFADVVDTEVGTNSERLERELTTEIIGLPTFDSAAARLHVLRRFRGVGDCGLLLTYAFPPEGPTLVQLRGRIACESAADAASGQWPPLSLSRR